MQKRKQKKQKKFNIDLFNSPGQLTNELKKEEYADSQSKHFYQIIKNSLGSNLLFNKIIKQKILSISLS